MVPLDKLVMMKSDTTPVEFEKAVSRTGFSRFPMLDDDGMLSGYLHIKDVLSIPDAAYHQPIAESHIRSLANLAMDDEIEKAMSVMQRTGSHLARVIGPDGTHPGRAVPRGRHRAARRRDPGRHPGHRLPEARPGPVADRRSPK